MLRSMRNRLSQSGGSRAGSRENSIDFAESSRPSDNSLDGVLDCDEDGLGADDPFDAGFDQRPPSRSATTERRRKLRRLHSASSAVAMDDRIEVEAAAGSGNVQQQPQPQQQHQSLKQRAKNFLFRRRSFSSLQDAGQHRVDGKPVRIDPRLVRGYAAAKRHHSDDCVLDSGHAAAGSRDSRGGNDSNNNNGTGEGAGIKKKNKFSRSLNFFASMRRRSGSREVAVRSPAPATSGAAAARTSAGGSSSEGGWTDPGVSEDGAAGGSSTLGRRGHRNSEQYMAPPQAQQFQRPQQPRAPQRQLSSAKTLATNLNEISGLCMERLEHRGPTVELFANWPAVPLEAASAWLGGGGSKASKSKRHSVAMNGNSHLGGHSVQHQFNSGSMTRRGYAPDGSLEASSFISGSTAEQLNVLCRQFNQAVTLRRSYRSKENLTGRLQRRSSGNWSGSSGSSSRTVESKSFTKQLSNSTTASKDSALEMKFDDEPHPAAVPVPAPAATPLHQPRQQPQSHQPYYQPHYQPHLHPQQQQHLQHYHDQRQYNQPPQYHQQQHQGPTLSPVHTTGPQTPPQWTVAHLSGQYLPQHRQQQQQQHQHQQLQYSPHHHPQHQLHHRHQTQTPRASDSVPSSPSPADYGDETAGAVPVPPRRSTSLRRSGPAAPAASDEGPISPTYLNHLALKIPVMQLPSPAATSSPGVTSHSHAMTSSPAASGGLFRLDQITESPDEGSQQVVPTPKPTATPLNYPPEVTTAPPTITSTPLPLPYRTQRSLIEDMTMVAHEANVGNRQWPVALPYQPQSPPTPQTVQPPPPPPTPQTVQPPPPRPRPPLLPTGDSARIVREARAKLSQLNRLSAELAKKQLRPGHPPPACPFDVLSATPPAIATASPAANVVNGNRQQQQQPATGSDNWRNSLLLQDEMAVREYLKDLTAMCSTDY